MENAHSAVPRTAGNAPASGSRAPGTPNHITRREFKQDSQSLPTRRVTAYPCRSSFTTANVPVPLRNRPRLQRLDILHKGTDCSHSNHQSPCRKQLAAKRHIEGYPRVRVPCSRTLNYLLLHEVCHTPPRPEGGVLRPGHAMSGCGSRQLFPARPVEDLGRVWFHPQRIVKRHPGLVGEQSAKGPCGRQCTTSCNQAVHDRIFGHAL